MATPEPYWNSSESNDLVGYARDKAALGRVISQREAVGFRASDSLEHNVKQN